MNGKSFTSQDIAAHLLKSSAIPLWRSGLWGQHLSKNGGPQFEPDKTDILRTSSRKDIATRRSKNMSRYPSYEEYQDIFTQDSWACYYWPDYPIHLIERWQCSGYYGSPPPIVL
jgi:hypothetical protein